MHWTTALATLAMAGLGDSARAGAITEIVAFGDSLSDVGNTFLAGGIPPSPPFYPGGYSNGPNWLAHFAARLGVATPTASLAGGTDYAWGGAETGEGLSSQGTVNLNSQVSAFLTSNTLNADQLVTVWAGANDFLNGGQTDPTVVVANIAKAITTLAAAGGENFLAPNLPLLGELPATNVLPQPMRDALNGLTMAFNGLLQAEVATLSQTLGVSIKLLDISSVFQDMITHPADYNLTNVTGSALYSGAPDDPGYLFWDDVHPTTTVHALIGELAFKAVVPEPSSIVLLAIPAVATAFCGRSRARRRKAA
jgi:phospholipase/lecithinase/hemolysin